MKRKTNKNYKFGNALKEASPLFHAKYGKKGKYEKKGGNSDEVVKQNGGGAMDIINGIDIEQLTSTEAVNDAINKLNEIVIDDTYTDTDADTSATKEQLIAAKNAKKDALEKKLRLLEENAPIGTETDVPVTKVVKPVEGENPPVTGEKIQGVDAQGGKKAKKSAKKGKKSAKKGGKKARKSAKKRKC